MLKAYELTERTRKSEKGQKAVASRAHWRYFNAPAQVGQSEQSCGTNTLQLAMDGRREQKRELLELLRGEPARTNLFNTFQSVDSRKQILLRLG
jgi:hypothetical protein